MAMRYIFGALAVCVCLGGLAGTAWAHGSGASFEAVAGEYLIDIGYAPAPLEATLQARFDFALQSATSSRTIAFTDIWVQVRDENTTLFAGGIARARIGATGFSYVFPHAGIYELSARFHDGGTALAEHTFAFEVAEGTTAARTTTASRVWWALGGAVFGALLALLFIRRA